MLTSASSPPASRAASASAWRCSLSVTSPGMATTRVSSASSARAASRSSAPRAFMIRIHPSLASLRASARPRPREAPVIKAVFVSRSMTLLRFGVITPLIETGGGPDAGEGLRSPDVFRYVQSMHQVEAPGIVHGDGFRPVRRYRYAGPVLAGHPDKALPGGEGDGLGAVVGAELGEYRADVELDGPLGDEEPRGDLAVVQTLGDETEDLELPWREGLRLLSPFPHVVEQAVRHAGLEQRAASVDGPDGVEDLCPRGTLEQVSPGSRAQGAEDALIGVVGGEDDGASLGPGVAQALKGRDTVHVGHLEIQEYHIRPEHLGQPHGLGAVSRFAYHVEVRLGAQDGDEALA